jgi:hypothetical protein
MIRWDLWSSGAETVVDIDGRSYEAEPKQPLLITLNIDAKRETMASETVLGFIFCCKLFNRSFV